MRFLRLETRVFGPLTQREFPVDSDIVLVHGPNEAGKSSFRAAIETLLYGFKPADRDAHPLAQWDPDNPQILQLAGEFRLDGGEQVCVERALQRSAKLSIARDGEDISGNSRSNRALTWVDWLAREVFRELYSLELEQLAELDPSARADIDDLLMPHTSALPLRTPTEIRAELDGEFKKLWRADRRGNTEERKLRKQLTAARERVAATQQRDRELRDARSERADIERELEAMAARKLELETERADAEFLGALFEWNRRARALGPEIDLSALGDRQLVQPSELDAEIEAIEEKLRQPRTRLAREECALGAAAARLLERASDIERALERASHWSADCERLAEQQQDAAKARERARDELRAALGGEPSDDELERAASVPIEALASAAADWSDARDREFAAGASQLSRLKLAEVVTAGAGLALIAAGLYAQLGGWSIGLGALLLGAGLCAAWFARIGARRASARAPRELAALFSGLTVPASLFESPAGLQRLVGLLVGVQRSFAQARERARSASDLDAQLREREDGWRRLCTRVDIDAEGDGDQLIARLRAALESARSEHEAVETDRRERAEAQRLIAFEKPALDAKSEHRRQLRETLQTAEPGCSDLDDAYRRVMERREEADYLRKREAELNRDSRFAAFENDPRVVAERVLDRAPWLSETRTARESELREVDAQISSKQRRLGEISKLLAGDAPGAVADAADAEREVREAIANCERERDRLALLEAILGRAEREFRDEHQPDVLRRASDYLAKITEGRYRRIDMLDGDKGLLGVTPDGRSEPIEVGEPISRGTLDQIFLCLRLGMLDHLDDGRERLPLILDDALLRIDDQRRLAVYALLANIAPTRQVWLLTCHGALADEVESQLEVSRIDL
ncbi:MAG: AAA family ATPase [Deltaproteobacteria bacterium]|jgi:uncharacterized protein YhaN|nr:AAA family ATPase [Deltaproteobacteria bacterium]